MRRSRPPRRAGSCANARVALASGCAGYDVAVSSRTAASCNRSAMTPTDGFEFQRCSCRSRLRAVGVRVQRVTGIRCFEARAHRGDLGEQVAIFLAGLVARGSSSADQLQRESSCCSGAQVAAHREQLPRRAVDALQRLFGGRRGRSCVTASRYVDRHGRSDAHERRRVRARHCDHDECGEDRTAVTASRCRRAAPLSR